MKQIHLAEIDSTQTYLQQLLQNNPDLGQENIIISTNNQTGGKGRGRNIWESGEGSIAFSFLCSPPKIITLAALEISILICEFFKENKLLLKWPNDILYKKKKVGGVLIQVVNEKLIIGIGLNIFDNKKNIYPGFTENFDCSMYESIPKEFYQYFLKNRLNEKDISNKWLHYCAHLEQNVTLSEDQLYKGVFKGIGRNGQALIQIADEIQEFYNGSLNLSL